MYLPQEILARIALHSNLSTRANLLTASHATQAAVEEVCWDSTFALQCSKIPRFLQLYRGHRVRLLRKIIFTFEFPEVRTPGYVEYMVYPDTDDEDSERGDVVLPCRETAAEIRANDELFTDQITRLFAALQTLEGREVEAGDQGVARTLSIVTPTQNIHGHVCEHRRYSSWRLHLLSPEKLPELSSIRTLVIGEGARFGSGMGGSPAACERPIDPRVVFALVGKMPCLEVLDVRYIYDKMPYPYEADVNRHHSRPFEGPRRDGRIDAARAMAEVAGHEMLKHVTIRFGDIESLFHMDQSVALPDLVSPSTFDPLSAALRVYSQQLVSLELLSSVDRTFFWPGEGEDGTEPFWPRMKNLKVIFHPAAPSGRWYFQGPKGEGRHSTGFAVGSGHYPPMERQELDGEWDEDWGRYENSSLNMFRTKPIDEEVEGLLEAFARALDVMPVLEVAELVTYLDLTPGDDEDIDLSGLEKRRVEEMEISSRDVVCRWGVKYVAGRVDSRLEWYVDGWRPSWELEKLFCRVIPREQWVFL